MVVVTPSQMKFLEAEADKNGNSYEMLMETAGKKLSEKIYNMNFKNVTFLCGNGNNAGDCFVAARYLEKSGINCTVALVCGEPKTDISMLNFKRLKNTNIIKNINETIEALKNMDDCLVVDGVFGTGFRGELPESIIDIFSACENKKVLAVDVPSGGNCITGAVSYGMLKADETITFGFEKFGMTQYPLKSYCGNIIVADIGIPESFCENFEYIIKKTEYDIIKKIIPERKPDSHKGNYGRLLTVCGSESMPGACIMAVTAALKSGAGLVQAAVPEMLVPVLAAKTPEAMICSLKTDSEGFITCENFNKISDLSEKSTALLIGCGLGVTDETKKLVKKLIQNVKIPIILDADGINCIADSIDIIKQSMSDIIVTPHPAEMGRLCSESTSEIQSDRLKYALSLAGKYKNLTVVLKGAGTLVVSSGKVYVNNTGNAGMAKGGSGDVLAGITASLTAQGIGPAEASCAAVFIHGLAGDNAAEKFSMQSMSATDIIKCLPDVFKNIC